MNKSSINLQMILQIWARVQSVCKWMLTLYVWTRVQSISKWMLTLYEQDLQMNFVPYYMYLPNRIFRISHLNYIFRFHLCYEPTTQRSYLWSPHHSLKYFLCMVVIVLFAGMKLSLLQLQVSLSLMTMMMRLSRSIASSWCQWCHNFYVKPCTPKIFWGLLLPRLL